MRRAPILLRLQMYSLTDEVPIARATAGQSTAATAATHRQPPAVPRQFLSMEDQKPGLVMVQVVER